MIIMEKRKKKVRLKKGRFAILLATFLIVIIAFYYLFNLRIMQIEITGTNLLTDNEIIEIAGIKNYPKLFSVSSFSIKNRIKKLDLVNDVKVSKNLYGKLSIKVDEARVLFYNKNNDKIVLSNEKEIDFSQNYLGIPTLLNYVPSDIYKDLVKGLNYIDDDVLRLISEIEYSPSKTQDGEVIDDNRFMLRMNDTNIVYMNTINIKKINKYMEITSTIIATNEEKHGVLYLDSSIEDRFSFESFESIKRTEEANKKKEEERLKEEEKKKKEEERKKKEENELKPEN